MTNPYSPLKVVHHPDKLAALRRGEQPVPAQVMLVISDLCNHNCSFCSYRQDGYSSNQLFSILRDDGTKNHNPHRMIPFEKVMEILDDCQALGVKAIQITGGGEPTVHPQHEAIFRAVLDRGLELALVTNGARLTDDVAKVLVHARWVRISVDAGQASTYARMRQVSAEAYERTWANVRKLVHYREFAGTPCRIGIGFVVTQENWLEVVSATRRARDAGVDNIRLSAFFQNAGADYYQDLFAPIAHQCRDAEALATAEFSVFNNFGDRLADLEEARPDYSFCGYQHFTTYIGADLNVYRCCVLAYNERGAVGSLRDQRFAELWNSQAKRDNFDAFDARACDRCMFNNRNRAILYAIEPHPADVNFV